MSTKNPDEATKAWEIGRKVGMQCDDEEGITQSLRRSQRRRGLYPYVGSTQVFSFFLSMSFFFCNVRGVNNSFKDQLIRDTIHKEKAQFVGLMETRLAQCSKQKVTSLWGNSPVEYLTADA